MKNLLRLEELAQLAIAVFAICCQSIHLPGWFWPVLFLTPDVGMLGYLINPRAGAITYNLTHHKGIAIALVICGWQLNMPVLLLTGLLLYAHSSFDRILGYGMKYADAFRHTHLGWLPLGRKA